MDIEGWRKKAELFHQYYESEVFLSHLILPRKPSFHHFRFQSFSSNRFYRIKQTIKYKKELQSLILRRAPSNIYFTPVKWLMPNRLRRGADYMLSSPLYFDVDSRLFSNKGLNEVAQTTKRLVNFIESKYAKHPSWIIFSGRRGFHIYYWDWDDIPKRYDRASDRISAFRKTRQEIVRELQKVNIQVDHSVTSDPWRLLRVPGTLHGETGYIALKIGDPVHFHIEMANPQADQSAAKYNHRNT